MKTLAWCLSHTIAPAEFDARNFHIKNANEIPLIYDFNVADLTNGRADNDIKTVERIRLIINYLKSIVDAAVLTILARPCNITGMPATAAGMPRRLCVLVENQMGQNTPARTIMDAIIAHYSCIAEGMSCGGFTNINIQIIIIGPALKNTICLCDGLTYGNYTEKYKTLYTANKNHARDNFEYAMRQYNPGKKTINNRALSGHIADAYCQTVGFVHNYYNCNSY